MSRFPHFVIWCSFSLLVLLFSGNAGVAREFCKSDEDCKDVENFQCIDGGCACKPGYVREKVNYTDSCKFIGVPLGEKCLSDASCINPNRTYCGSKEVCTCRSGYYAAAQNHVCKEGKRLGEACKLDSSCEAFNNLTYCKQTCQCRVGYIEHLFGGKRTCIRGNLPRCNSRYDCSPYELHMLCIEGLCQCNYNYHIKYIKEFGWICESDSSDARLGHPRVISLFRISPAAILIACIVLGYMRRRQKCEMEGSHERPSFSRPHRYPIPFRRGVTIRQAAQRLPPPRPTDSFDHLLPSNTVVDLPPEPPPYKLEEEPPPSYEEAIRDRPIPPLAQLMPQAAARNNTNNLSAPS